jgi:ABC-type glycerol-3-phosphate transport system substrate-binding protein
MLNNIPYIVSPVAWPEKQPNGCTYLVVINEAIIKQYDFTDPRELVEQGQWTWNKFEELLPQYTIKDGEHTTYAFHGFPHFIAKMAVLSNGVRIVDEVDGALKTDIYGEKAIDALNWVKKIINDNKDYVITKGGTWEESYTPFVNGETVMCLTNTGSVVTKVSFKVDDFGIVPFPCGPQGEYGKWASVLEGVEGAGILVNAEEPEYAAHIISEMFEPFEGYEGREGLLNYYTKQILYDKRDAETYLDISKYGRYSYWPVGGDSFWGSVSNGIKSQTGSELVQKYGPQLEKVVDEYISTNYEYIKDHIYK